MVLKSLNVFSSIIKMKLCVNLKDTMYFLRFLPSPEQRWGLGIRMKRHMFMFSFRSDFKILNYLLLIIDFINYVHYCIRIDDDVTVSSIMSCLKTRSLGLNTLGTT